MGYTGFTKIVETPENIISMQKLGGFMRRSPDGKRYWYPERLMIASKNGIYEWVPEEQVIAVYPVGKTYKFKFKKANQDSLKTK